MNKKSGSGSGIFLMEMMVVVCFFILCASVCILAFAKSDRLSRLAEERNHAVLAAQSVIEVWKAEDTEGLAGRFQAEKAEDGWMIGWDKEWQPVGATAQSAAFVAELKLTADSALQSAVVAVWNVSEHETLFELEASDYKPQG